MQEFQLRIVPTDNNNFALELYQCAYKQAGAAKRPPAKFVGRLKGSNLVQAREVIYSALKQNNYDPKTLSHNRQAPYVLNETIGVNLALIFTTLQPMSKPERIANIVSHIRAMSDEESHYWFAKVSNGRRRAALKALRILYGE
jgi:hypothetical protein